MVSIRLLLDTFGPPPREICLDWAHQLSRVADLSEAGNGSIPALNNSYDPTSDEPHWTNLEVAGDGRLQLEGLTASAARSALGELREWLARDASYSEHPSAPTTDTLRKENELGAETAGACATIDQSRSACGLSQPYATSKRTAKRSGRAWSSLQYGWTGAGVLIAALITLISCMWIGRDVSQQKTISATASPSVGSEVATSAKLASPSRAADTAPVEDFLVPQHNEALASGGWTTSAELTSGALDESAVASEKSTASASSTPLRFAPAPSLSAASAAPATALPTKSLEAVDRATSPAVATADKPKATDEKKLPSTEVGDVMGQVAAAVAQAESQNGDIVSDVPSTEPAIDAGASSEGLSNDAHDLIHQAPLMLTRDIGILRPPVPRGFLRRLREPHWTARVELADDFICEPAPLQTLDTRTGAQWRIYDSDAKSPRACIIVSANRRSGRDHGLQWSLRGSAEDFPDLRLPIARKWLDALTAQLQVTAVSLRATVDSPTQGVPRELRSLMQNQRQLARQQLAVADRLLTLFAEIDRLASLLDDELLCHAELRENEGGAILLAYGSCQTDKADNDDAPSN